MGLLRAHFQFPTSFRSRLCHQCIMTPPYGGGDMIMNADHRYFTMVTFRAPLIYCCDNTRGQLTARKTDNVYLHGHSFQRSATFRALILQCLAGILTRVVNSGGSSHKSCRGAMLPSPSSPLVYLSFMRPPSLAQATMHSTRREKSAQ